MFSMCCLDALVWLASLASAFFSLLTLPPRPHFLFDVFDERKTVEGGLIDVPIRYDRADDDALI